MAVMYSVRLAVLFNTERWRESSKMTVVEQQWHLVCCCEPHLLRYFLELNLHAGFPVITSLKERERERESEREIVLIGYLDPLDVDWSMEQHHYNLSSGSNLNRECPLPTVLPTLESVFSLLESLFLLLLKIEMKPIFEEGHIYIRRLSLFSLWGNCTHFPSKCILHLS